MELKLIFTDLRTEEYVKPLEEQDLSFLRLVNHYVKNNYDVVWHDFVDGDEAEALTHAKQEIEFANIHTGDERLKHLKRACQDLSNYLIAISCLYQEECVIYSNMSNNSKVDEWEEDAKKLITALAIYRDIRIDDWVYDALIQRYGASDILYEEYALYPDYDDLYAQLGDIALFTEGDVDRAIIWYRLAGFDWYELIENTESNEDMEERERLLWWIDFMEIAQNMMDASDANILYPYYIDLMDFIQSATVQFRNCLKNYLDACEKYNDGDDLTIINKEILELLKQTESDIKEEQSREIVRTELTIANILKPRSSYHQLKTICGEYEVYNDSKDDASIFRLIDESDQDKVAPVTKYLDETTLEEQDKIKGAMHLVNAIELSDCILSTLKIKSAQGLVAYYTSYGNLGKMLPETSDSTDNIGKFAVMHVSYMNDPNEGKLLEKWLLGKQKTDSRQRADYPFVFIKCFTPRIDDLPMWEMYGDHAKGCCMVIDMLNLQNRNGKDFPIYDVCYIRQEEGKCVVPPDDNQSINSSDISRLQTFVDKLTEAARYSDDEAYRNAIISILSNITYLFKHADYSYECEKRIVYNTTDGLSKRIRHTKTNNTPRLYVLSDMSIGIKELIVGPKFEDPYVRIPYLQERLDKMIRETGDTDRIPISYSAIEYK